MADINQTAEWVTARLTEVGNATNGGLNTLVTSDNIGNYNAGNVEGVVAVANGGTGADNAADARTNLGITPANIGAVPASGGTFTGEVTFADDVNISGDIEITGDLTVGGSTVSSLNSEVTDIRTGADGTVYSSAGDAVRGQVEHLLADFAPAYSSTGIYAEGDFCTYGEQLYKCISAIDTAEEWNSAHWIAMNVRDDITEIERSIILDSIYSLGNRWIVFGKGRWIIPTNGDTTYYEASSIYSCAKVPCSEGDIFTVQVYGRSGQGRGWCFVDSSMGQLTKAASENAIISTTITAPANAAYLLLTTCNSKNTSYPYSDYYAFKGLSLGDKAFKRVRSLSATDDFDNIMTTGWYFHTASATPISAPKSNTTGMLIVIDQSDTRCLQIWYGTTSQQYVYVRQMTSAGWQDWQLLITEDVLNTYNLRTTDYQLPTYSDISGLTDSNGVISSSGYIKKNVYESEESSILVTIESKYTGSAAPTLQIICIGLDGSTWFYYSPKYSLGRSTEYIKQTFRIPNGACISAYRLSFTIPSGSTLAVRAFDSRFEATLPQKQKKGIIFHAHMGFDALYPVGSYNGIIAASELGFGSCIVIPKRTSDGVWVCFHDDDKISRQMTQEDGTAIPTEYDLPISQLTYAELMQWSIGYSYRPYFAGDKILQMEDFLRVCAETGMRPIFSVHPVLSVSEWQELKEMLDRFKLTKYLSVKSADYDNVWKRAINVFGNGNIYSIILLYSSSATYDILDYISAGVTASGLDLDKTRLDCEFFHDGLNSSSIGTTQTAQLEAALNDGYICSVVMSASITGAKLQSYIDMGVTEFTNTKHCSNGLIWTN